MLEAARFKIETQFDGVSVLFVGFAINIKFTESIKLREGWLKKCYEYPRG